MRRSQACFFRVAVLGAAGGIGQPLSLLLKNNKYVKELKLYDVKGAPGVAADLSHICAPAKVTGYTKDELSRAVEGVDVVVIPAGIPRKPGMTRDDLFNTNASIVRDLAIAVGTHAPKAIVGIITNPVNSTVPVAAEALKKVGVYDPARLFGVTTLDVVRARTFVGEALGKSPLEFDIPVVGGHSGETIVPLLSGFPSLSEEQVRQLTHRIQFGGDEVVKAKDGAGSATLSMAFAGNEWTTAVLRALSGEKGVVVCTYVQSTVEPSCAFFSSPVLLGNSGVEKIYPVPMLNSYEEKLMAKCLEGLQGNIKKGIAFGNK
ncbi:malate dehydrogenase [Leishmania infantum JPCM5]|uniref:Malate dehydrogenase n=2 Tax=Leishmania infantum TaxID=5671 RepID=A4I9I3_LEIIN|nr:malate dehydrogenase [Leishmania infantum JPCM5]CAC9535754.1 malate_dehydrogenase [Leishmania infantum]CAM71486.1 malate dehydrogenase [Leishmania infantum JPCM5]SUZ45375.1 malate_dehydrogenase [Leishmania infantum]|eukprot:XP_001468402.1 malate dehydrogenase [Leishmania infantum JPCM5]